MRFMVAIMLLAVVPNVSTHAQEPPSDGVGRFMSMAKSSDEQVRCYAVYSLGKKRDKAVSAVPLLVEMLGKDTQKVREHILVALRDQGRHARPAVPALVRILAEDMDPQMGRLAAEALADIAEPDVVVPAIVEWVARPSNTTKFSFPPSHVASAIIRDLGEKAHPGLRTALRNPKHRATVVELLHAMRGDAVAFHASNVRDRDSGVAKTSVEELAKLGSAAIPGLVAALDHADPAVRDRAGEALLDAGAHGKTMDRHSPHAVLAVAAIIPMVKNPAPAVRRRALIALVNHGGVDRREALLGLADADTDIRKELCHAFSQWGPDAALAVTPLAERLTDADHRVRLAAAEALWKIEGRTVRPLPTLLAALGNKDAHVRYATVTLLGEMGKSAEAAAPSLEHISRHDADADVRAAAAHAYLVVRGKQP